MHSLEVNIRICQPEKVMFTEAKHSFEVRLGEHHFLGLTNSDVNLKCINCMMLLLQFVFLKQFS